MFRWIKILGCTAALAVAGSASALPPHDYDEEDYDYVWARVVSVEPIVAYASGPRRVCWEQPVAYYEPGRYYPTYRRDASGALVGALIGGAIGSQIGSGSGRDAATVAGAIAGAAIGSERGGYREGYYYDRGYRRVGYERVCERRRRGWTEGHVIGYDVAYRLDGRIYHTRTDEHPGRRIRVAIMDYDDYDDYRRRY
jgi:uncharacterized protein YcfJ